MANGDLLTADYQFQLHNTLYGRGNNGVYLENGKNPIEGLGVPEAKIQDVEYWGRDGSYANPDYLQLRLITISAMVKGTSIASMMTSFKSLTQSWIPLTADTDLAFQLPGWNKFMVNGRPRGLKADLTNANRGVVRVLMRFDCPDPTITYL
jgi:hypothetical protein